jgi:hypothetical protein
MYYCSKCGLGVLVANLPEPIRACDCKTSTEVTLENGEKQIIEKNASIICEVTATAEGRSQFKN